MGKLKLPRLISDGMVLQQKKKVHIWGWNEPGRRIMVSFLGEEQVAVTDEEGRWEVWLSMGGPGGPYIMHIGDDTGDTIMVSDVWVGDVWMCSGQSNMELPIRRVAERYPDEVADCKNPAIRTFKIVEYANFHGPLSDHLTGEWKEACEENILDFSATAYFFAREMSRLTKVPVGLINASLGGSRIQSWMSRKMLEGCEEYLAVADQYADDVFVAERLRQNEQNTMEWHGNLQQMDKGVAEGWEQEAVEEEQWKPIEVPCFFRDTELAGFIGSIWLRRKFVIENIAQWQNPKLFFGTMVDSDTVYINGEKVGQTEYQYPPRRYAFPAGILREGENTIVIRLKCDNGEGRITPGKELALKSGDSKVELSGQWLYRIGATCEAVKPTDFVNWKPTGLYNGMTAPCHPYTIAGVIWYQGEANANKPECDKHVDMMKRLVTGYREAWGEADLPFYYVQLPNFRINVYYGSWDEGQGCWPEFREQQRLAQEIPGTGMVVAIDLGEDNDLHPLNKKDVGGRLAALAASRQYGLESECSGPVVKEVTEKTWKQNGSGNRGGSCIRLLCEGCDSGLLAAEGDKGADIKDFELVDANGKVYVATVKIAGKEIVLRAAGMDTPPVAIRYCFDYTNKGALVYNGQGYPMGPFIMEI